MVFHPRNFSSPRRLHVCTTLPMPAVSGNPVLALRSLPPIVADAIPRRFSSSSLPPSFASGRFAGPCFSSHRSPRRAAAHRA